MTDTFGYCSNLFSQNGEEFRLSGNDYTATDNQYEHNQQQPINPFYQSNEAMVGYNVYAKSPPADQGEGGSGGYHFPIGSTVDQDGLFFALLRLLMPF